MPEPRRFAVSVPVVLELRVESTMHPDDTLAAIIAAFQDGADPFLGATLIVQRSFKIVPRLEFVHAKTRGAELITGIAAFRPTLREDGGG